MKSKLMPTAVLGVICLVVALLLSAINLITAPEIEKRQHEKTMEALREVMPDATDLKPTNEYKSMIDEKITSVWEGDEGFVFEITTKGKNPGMIILIGIDRDGRITGTKCTADEETPSYADPVLEDIDVGGYFKDKTSDTFKPYVKSGATMTASAYSSAVSAALAAYDTINGGN